MGGILPGRGPAGSLPTALETAAPADTPPTDPDAAVIVGASPPPHLSSYGPSRGASQGLPANPLRGVH